ncbi:hypothetical protein [Plantibacter sp. ME-Dv--P-122b]|uniref:hypothetical protein n=1 Tax=Plantibacter sp. ME-Dv--P-122b TaxID=3040300 RepID=UPI0025507A42|nr:hypothetical protein [Plantibacter sp. ME-Dv--P-122b]
MSTISSPRTLSTLALAVGLLALTACTDVEPAPPPSSTPPVFENEEQALAAVTETYQEFMRISNTILVEGGVDVDRIDVIVGEDLAEFEHGSLIELATAGKTLVGAPALVSTRLSEWYPAPDSLGVIAKAKSCIDLTPVDVLDAAGNSTVRPDRPRTRTWAYDVGVGGKGQSDYVLLAHDVSAEGESCEI